MTKPDFTNTPLEHCEGHAGPCDNTDAEWQPNSARYVNERANWNYLCKECRAFSDEYWRDMWDEYRHAAGY